MELPACTPDELAVECARRQEATAADSLLLFYRNKFDTLERELAALQEQQAQLASVVQLLSEPASLDKATLRRLSSSASSHRS